MPESDPTPSAAPPLTGRCTCGAVRYRLEGPPMFVNACHCRWCQRETGSAFVINAMIESDRLTLLAGAPVRVDTPSESGRGQVILRCPACQVAVWSHYPDAGDAVAFVRVGTLDEPDRLPPDIHLFTASRQPWVALPAGTPAVPGFCDPRTVWPAESQARYRAMRARRSA